MCRSVGRQSLSLNAVKSQAAERVVERLLLFILLSAVLYTAKRVPGPVLIKKFSDTSKAFMGILGSQAYGSSTSALRWVSVPKGTKFGQNEHVCLQGGGTCHDWWASFRSVMCT